MGRNIVNAVLDRHLRNHGEDHAKVNATFKKSTSVFVMDIKSVLSPLAKASIF